MSIGLIAVLIVSIILIAAGVSYLLQSGENQKDNQPYTPSAYSKEELDNIKLAEELYNKDLRPAIVKKDKPKASKQVYSREVTPQVIERVEELSKVLPENTTINLEAVKPAKKKKKYYPKTNN